MYAVVRSGGKQYRVSPGDELLVETVDGQPGETVDLGEVLMLVDGDQVRVGTPLVDGAAVRATVVAAERSAKVQVFKFKAKKRYRRHATHRQSYTSVKIDDIVA